MIKEYIRKRYRNTYKGILPSHPYGVFLGEMRDGIICYGFSLCMKTDKWDKKEAMNRAKDSLNQESKEIPHSLKDRFARFQKRCVFEFIERPANKA